MKNGDGHRRKIGHLTLASWAGDYGLRAVQADLLAGVTIGVVLVPQAMAYALIAGLPAVYGLYASIVPLLVYALFGQSPRLSVGIVALDMLILGDGLARMQIQDPTARAEVAVFMAFVVGFFHILGALMRVGVVGRLIARPVMMGFMLAAPLLIAVGQLENLLGLSSSEAHHPILGVWTTMLRVEDVQVAALSVAIAAIGMLLLMQRWRPVFPHALLVVVGGGLLIYLTGISPTEVPVLEHVDAILPPLRMPPLSLEMLDQVWPTALALAVMQLITVLSIGKTTARRSAEFQPESEITAIGAANVVGSFFGGIPISASFSRTAVGVQAGAVSPVSNAVAAAVVTIGLLIAAHLFELIPVAVLGAIIVVSVVRMIDLNEVRAIFAISRQEGYIVLATAMTALLVGIHEGILVGAIAALARLAITAGRPKVVELGEVESSGIYRDIERNPQASRSGETLILRVDGSMVFATADFIRERVVRRLDEARHEIAAVVIDGRGINRIDSTGIEAITELANELRERDIELHLAKLKAPVREAIARSALVAALANVRLDATIDEALASVSGSPS